MYFLDEERLVVVETARELVSAVPVAFFDDAVEGEGQGTQLA